MSDTLSSVSISAKRISSAQDDMTNGVDFVLGGPAAVKKGCLDPGRDLQIFSLTLSQLSYQGYTTVLHYIIY